MNQYILNFLQGLLTVVYMLALFYPLIWGSPDSRLAGAPDWAKYMFGMTILTIITWRK